MSVNKNNIISFLSELSENNHKLWFDANKQSYLEAKQEMEDLVQNVIERIAEFDSSVADQQAKKCVFRIYRDVRFSKNKEPYKNNMGGFIVPGGKKSGKAGYYLHLEPGNSFIAGGVYMPESANLKKIREEVLYNTKVFKSIIESDKFVETFGQVEGEKLKRPPKGFPADFADVELLKFKSYTVLHKVPDAEVNNSGFVNQVIEAFKVMKDFNHFLNQAMD
ncbi:MULTISPECIES: DUF2461 domain-containing protein [unclassified Lentimicrobium]|uniref:DUF2461 domain-containing protein n=1 Tax=unclassified Lentimicrobium TaxID=2677434 RepID=UPI00155564F5|nr:MULTISPECIES: DUF2461 domain-containing protein [unclassified Lentimicrobium]NPD46863.1 DUF2461 domain-containing protein [Lentimicrobium sp. S6]NPD84446.1 DUF2461 domain-containing protein [Lentimicrobium sp. L6]